MKIKPALKYFLIAFFLLSTYSCKRVTSSRSENADVPLIRLSDCTGEVSITDIVDTTGVSFVPYDTALFIGVIKDITDSLILFYSPEGYIVGDHKGKILNSIGHIGRGPHEYFMNESSVCFNGDDEVVVISNNSKLKLDIFSTSGEWKRDVILDLKVSKVFTLTYYQFSIGCVNGHFIMCFQGNGTELEDYPFWLCFDMSSGKQVFSRPSNVKGDYYSTAMFTSGIQLSDESFNYKRVFNDTLFSINEQGAIPKYIIDPGNKRPTKEMLSSKSEQEKPSDIFCPIPIIETEKWLIMYGKKDETSYCYNKQTGVLSKLTFLDEWWNYLLTPYLTGTYATHQFSCFSNSGTEYIYFGCDPYRLTEELSGINSGYIKKRVSEIEKGDASLVLIKVNIK